MQGGMKNHDFLLISCFISELMQGEAIVTMEGEILLKVNALNNIT